MTDNGTNPDEIPNGEGNGSTSDNAGDTTSGGAPDQPDQPDQPD